MNHREWESHARDVYPTQDTSSMRTERAKQEDGGDRNYSKIVTNIEEINVVSAPLPPPLID